MSIGHVSITAYKNKVYVEGWNNKKIYFQFADGAVIVTSIPVKTLNAQSEYDVDDGIIKNDMLYETLKDMGVENTTLNFIKNDSEIYPQYIATV